MTEKRRNLNGVHDAVMQEPHHRHRKASPVLRAHLLPSVQSVQVDEPTTRAHTPPPKVHAQTLCLFAMCHMLPAQMPIIMYLPLMGLEHRLATHPKSSIYHMMMMTGRHKHHTQWADTHTHLPSLARTSQLKFLRGHCPGPARVVLSTDSLYS